MPAYRIVLKDHDVEVIDGADAYQQEGQMTTFFRMSPGRQVIDSWSMRVASFRTSEVLAIRRLELLEGVHDHAGSCDRARRPQPAGFGAG